MAAHICTTTAHTVKSLLAIPNIYALSVIAMAARNKERETTDAMLNSVAHIAGPNIAKRTD
jgi:hypothetical protein